MKKNIRRKRDHLTSFRKVGKGSKGRGRPGGPCWTCRGPHFQRECPHASAGKGNYPISTAWSSWRPGTFPGPSAAQWNSWLPKPKGKGKGKGKGKNKGGKGDLKGNGKGHVNEMLNLWGSPLGQLQDSWSCAPAAHTEHWDPDSDLNSLLPICALKLTIDENCRARFLGTGQDPQSWTWEVESAREPNRLSFKDQPIDRFAVLADDMDKSFPFFNAEQKQHVQKPRTSAFPKEISQAASESAVRKKRTKVIAHSASK